MIHQPIHLASQSPRRRQLLDQLGVRHEPLLAEPDEDAESLELVLPGERAADYVQRVTALKLDAARRRQRRRGLPGRPILCADTTVVVGRRILGKPTDANEAIEMLAALSGRTHRVLTAVALWARHSAHAALSESKVTVAELSADDIAHYVASGEPFGKAGAYAIQSQFAGHIQRIDGSHSGIMGLPLYETAQLLKAARVSFG